MGAPRKRGSRQADIAIKRVYDPATPVDGCRVLIDRLWPRGVSKADARIDAWWKEFAPTSALRRWLHADQSRHAEFVRRYRKELAGQRDAIRQAVRALRVRQLTLLTAVKDTEQSHARVLGDFLRGLRP